MDRLSQLVSGLEDASGTPIAVLMLIAYLVCMVLTFLRYVIRNSHLPSRQVSKKIALVSTMMYVAIIAAVIAGTTLAMNMTASLISGMLVAMVLVIALDGHINRILDISDDRMLTDMTKLRKDVGVGREDD